MMFVLALLAFFLPSALAISGFACQEACSGTTTAQSQCKAGCTCAAATTNCNDWCSTTVPLGKSANLESFLYKYYASTSAVGQSNPTTQNNLYLLSEDPGWVANCLQGCQRRAVCMVNCPASTTTPSNGGKGTCGSSVNDGATCTETCNAGYQASGSATRTCTKGTLSASTLTCQTLNCAVSTTTPTNGAKGTCGQTTNNGATCTETCSAGYAPTGSASRTCTTGTLSPSTINCKKTIAECQKGGSTDAYKIGCNCENSAGSCAAFCDSSSYTAGYFLDGESTWTKYDAAGSPVQMTKVSLYNIGTGLQTDLPNFVVDCLRGCTNRGICAGAGSTDQECAVAKSCRSCLALDQSTTSSTATLGCFWCENSCKSTGIPSDTFPLNNDAAAKTKYYGYCNLNVPNTTEVISVKQPADYCKFSDKSAASGVGPSSMLPLALVAAVLSFLRA